MSILKIVALHIAKYMEEESFIDFVQALQKISHQDIYLAEFLEHLQEFGADYDKN